MRVLLVDDQPLVLAGLDMLLTPVADIEVVGRAGDGAEAVALAEQLRPDVVVMDLRMPVLDGVAATVRITADEGESKVLALTTFEDEALMFEALRAGASGYLLKHAAPTEIADAIRRVHGGGVWIDPTMTAKIIDVLRSRVITTGAGATTTVASDADRARIAEVLTPREQHVLRLVADGLSNRDIGNTLVLAEATVKTHVARILMKTGSRDRAAAVALAWRSGFAQRSPL
ncbi:response regulator [Millisia brevis]|uniref:response regulator n=1 Tax=Millisia brevis TaxID=264148 RepID=UPI00082B9ECC|nr:response regulator transcription factor [Millisia brevis]